MFRLLNDLGSDGILNCLLADGRFLFARCGDHLSHIVRQPPLGVVTLADEEVEVNLANVMRGDGSVAVVATHPLTRAEPWVAGTPGTLWVFRAGALVKTFPGLPEAAHVAATAWRPDSGVPLPAEPGPAAVESRAMLPRWNLGVRQGLEVVEIETAASTAVIALQGAQVLSFVPRGGRDWLWVSERARWAAGAALRGGIPLCFPWFGPHATHRPFQRTVSRARAPGAFSARAT